MSKTLRQLYAEAKDGQAQILDKVEREGRENLTIQETLAFDELERVLSQVKKLELEETVTAEKSAQRIPTNAANPNGRQTASISIGRNERTYNPDRDKEAGGKPGGAFLLDVGKAFLGDPIAQDRLTRHQREEFAERPGLEKRASSTSNFAGLVVPQYLTDLYAPAVAAMRPFADICNHHDLPAEGMSVNISRITTPTAAGLQSAENAALPTADIDDTLLTESVLTNGGSIICSRQAIERGTLTEEVTTSDLLKRYASALDSTLINQATTGLAAVSTSQSYVNATVDTTAIPAFWKQLIQAQNTVEGVLLAQAPPSHFIMAPRRWNWATAAISSSWPVIAGTNVPPQSWGAQLTNEYGKAVRAILPNGMLITVDANVSTVCLGTALTGGTQDQVYAVAADECHLWEDPNQPAFIRAEQPSAASLGILFVIYGYYAYSMRRYTGASVVVNGTGLATPSFV